MFLSSITSRGTPLVGNMLRKQNMRVVIIIEISWYRVVVSLIVPVKSFQKSAEIALHVLLTLYYNFSLDS